MKTILNKATIYAITKFNKKVLLDSENVNKVFKLLVKPDFGQKFGGLFGNPSDYITSIRCYPLTQSSLDKLLDFYPEPTKDNVSIGNLEGSVTHVRGRYTKQNGQRALKIAEMNIQRKFNNFMDYEPYTTMQMYIPYIGYTSVPTHEIVGKKVSVWFKIDFDNGVLTATIENEDHIIITTQGEIGINIPIGSSNANEIFRNRISSAVGLIGSVATDNPLGFAKSMTNMVLSSQQRFQTRGTISATQNSNILPASVFLLITYPNPIEIDENYNKIVGKPLNDYRTLSTLTGFTIVGDVHLEKFKDCTSEELNIIDSLLRNGVHL